MQNIQAKPYLTISLTAAETYVIEYDKEQYVDILNSTADNIKISNNDITDSNDYAVIPSGSAYNDCRIIGGKIYIIAVSAGSVSLIAR